MSEYYLAAARVMSWLYCSIGSVATDDVYVVPVVPQKKRNRQQNYGWLMARGLCITGKAAELKERVKEYIIQPEGPPAVLPPKGGEVCNVHKILVALKAMIEQVVAKEITEHDIDTVGFHIRLF